jgi:hypothetical protein
MRQDGSVVAIGRVFVDGRELGKGNVSLNGITTSTDSKIIYVTFTGPGESPGGVLSLPAF